MQSLIDGLPDAIAIRILARVPFYLHPRVQLVCRLWQAALHSPELLKARIEVGAAEELLCVSAFEPENLWQLYDPINDIWMMIPRLSSKIRHLANFGAVSVGGKLFILGGRSDAVDPLTGDHCGMFATNEVWSYDPIFKNWNKRAPMLVARAMFACGVLDGRIVVAGGFTDCRKAILKAEIYDPQNDAWEAIPDLLHTHNSACTGVVVEGNFHVLHKGLSTVQVLELKEERWVVEDFAWLQGPMAVLHGELYVYSHGMIIKQAKDQRLRNEVAPAGEFKSRIGFALAGMRDELYVIGGVFGPGPWNCRIMQLSDVHVFNVFNERPVWRQVSQMTRSRGTILGCTILKI